MTKTITVTVSKSIAPGPRTVTGTINLHGLRGDKDYLKTRA